MVKVYERECLSDVEIETGHEDDPILKLEAGKLYTVSEAKDDTVAVFTRYWFRHPTIAFGPPYPLGQHPLKNRVSVGGCCESPHLHAGRR